MVFIAVIRRMPGGMGCKTSKTFSVGGAGTLQADATMKQLNTYGKEWSKRLTNKICFGSTNPNRQNGSSTGPTGGSTQRHFSTARTGQGKHHAVGQASASFGAAVGPEPGGAQGNNNSGIALYGGSGAAAVAAPNSAQGNNNPGIALYGGSGTTAVAAGGSLLPSGRKKVTLKTVARKFRAGQKLSMITAYDYPTAQLADDSGMDIILVGDSLGMVVQGKPGTESVTLDEVIYHTAIVSGTAKASLVVGDMPFGSYLTPEQACANAVKLLKEGSCHAVKLEGGERVAASVAAMVGCGVAVMGHIGLTPQSAHALGGFTVQGRDAASAQKLVQDALALQEAGAFALVMEMVPAQLAAYVTAQLSIPTIGIGSGADCSGQVLVMHDAVGLFPHPPSFVRSYANVGDIMLDALVTYRREVESASFPAPQHQTEMKPRQVEEFYRLMGEPDEAAAEAVAQATQAVAAKASARKRAQASQARTLFVQPPEPDHVPDLDQVGARRMLRRVAVIGGGALGTTIADCLATAHDSLDVCVVSSRPAYVQAVNNTHNTNTGLRQHAKTASSGSSILEVSKFSLPGQQQQVSRVSFRAMLSDLNGVDTTNLHKFDLVIVATKTPGTSAAARLASKLISSKGHVMTVQNGMGNQAELERALGGDSSRVLVGVTSQSATSSSVTTPCGQQRQHVSHTGLGPTSLAPVCPSAAPAAHAVAAMFTEAGLETVALPADALVAMQWGKLAVNASINPLTALLGCRNGHLAASGTGHGDGLQGIMSGLIAEVVAVAAASGVLLDESITLAQSLEVSSSTAGNTSSMLADVIRGGETEVAAINGFVAREGQRVGVSTPLNSALATLVESMNQVDAVPGFKRVNSVRHTDAKRSDEDSTGLQQVVTLGHPQPVLTVPSAPAVLSSVAEWKNHRAALKSSQHGPGLTIGFVPTMGGLHEGHLALVRAARAQCDYVVVSIFVNPKQFAANEDLHAYPRTLDADCAKLEGLAHAVLVPQPDDMYPEDFSTSVTLTPFLKGKVEHERRPMFFNGVATVVAKLLSAVSADAAFFGQKDGLQCAVVRRLVRDLSLPTDVVICPTVREADGLAMSTRNQHLTEEERLKAPLLHLSLLGMQHEYSHRHGSTEIESEYMPPSVAALKSIAQLMLASEPAFSIEYVSCSTLDGAELTDEELVTDSLCSRGIMLSVAAQLGQCRLIDNIVLDGRAAAVGLTK